MPCNAHPEAAAKRSNTSCIVFFEWACLDAVEKPHTATGSFLLQQQPSSTGIASNQLSGLLAWVPVAAVVPVAPAEDVEHAVGGTRRHLAPPLEHRDAQQLLLRIVF